MTNHFADLLAAGYAGILPIIPPDAEIGERSSLLKRVGTHQDARGKVPGVRRQDGKWSSFDWMPYVADERDAERWHAMGAGAGLRTDDGLIAFDADTMDPALAAIIEEEIERVAGQLPKRVGRAPKAMYIARCVGLPYQRIDFGQRDARGNAERLEILAVGKQFVVAGIHPKTMQPYTWPRAFVPFGQLVELTIAQVEAILNALRQRLPAASAIIKEGSGTDVPQESLKGRLDAVERAMDALPNTSALFPSREDYRNIGYAIKAALPDEPEAAFEIWADWCFRWADGVNEHAIMESDWRRMKPPFKRGASWIYELAEKHGQFNKATAFFDDLGEEIPSLFTAPENATRDETLFKLMSIDDIEAQPEPRWLIDRHIPQVSMGFIYSDPGAGKSFLVLDMALSIAANLPDWHGDPIDHDGRPQVIYIAGEGAYGFKNRIAAWRLHRGNHPDLGRNFFMLQETINFMVASDVEKLLRTIRSAGCRPSLVVVDTVSRAMAGADENLQKDMTLFVKACDATRDAFKCAVIGVHHAGKSGDIRGSTVLVGAGDFIFELTRPKKARIGTLKMEKQKDGPDGTSDSYSFTGVTLGPKQTSLIVRRMSSALVDLGEADATPKGRAADVLAAMERAWNDGVPWGASYQSRERYAVLRMREDFAFTEDTAKELLEELGKQGRITVAKASAHSNLVGYKVLAKPVQDVQNVDLFG
jgi:hypothetical protein